MTDIEWVEPPTASKRGRPGQYDEFRTTLMASPGRWARFPGSPTKGSVASRIRQTWKPVGQWDATSRRNGHIEGQADVYVRFVGEQS